MTVLCALYTKPFNPGEMLPEAEFREAYSPQCAGMRRRRAVAPSPHNLLLVQTSAQAA